MRDDQLVRYARQIFLPEIDLIGQQRLLASHVVLIGLGGLGSPLALYLAASGVGHLTLCDFDQVEWSNLQRQIAYTESDVGHAKTTAMHAHLHAMNHQGKITLVEKAADYASLPGIIAGADVVADGSDNFTTRFAVNAACFAAQVPLVSAAVIRWEGQLGVFDPRDANSPCYQCLYPHTEQQAETCSTTGIVAPAAGVMGSLQALEVIKLLLGMEGLRGQLLIWDGKTQDFRRIHLRKDPACPVCTHAR